MGWDISLKTVELSGVTLLLMHLEGLIPRFPGFLDHLNFHFSIDEAFVLLDILVYDIENILVFRPQAFEEHFPSCETHQNIILMADHTRRNTCLPEEPHCLIMEFDDLCIEKTQVIGHLVAALKDLRYIAKLWKGRPNFMENVQQFIVTMKVTARNLCVCVISYIYPASNNPSEFAIRSA